MSHRTIEKLRAAAAKRQGGLCWYCQTRMLEGDAVATRRALLCTAEHLTPRAEGGRDSDENIVAACLFCNQRRHRRRVVLPPLAYQIYVRRRVKAGRWNAR